MKRTFLVEIESNGHPALWNDEAIQYRIMMSPRDSVTVTDITATHAKEREVIDECLMMARFDANGRGYDTRTSFSRVCILAHELRALMEGKTNG